MAQKRKVSRKQSAVRKKKASGRGRQSAAQKRKAKKTASSPLSTSNYQWWHLAIIAAITLIVYIPSLDNGFVNWDDPKYIVNNDVVHSFSGENIATSFTEEVSDNYHPLTNLSQTLDWVLGGGDAGIFHITSLLLHIINAILVFFLVMMLSGKQWVSLGSALIFALHPAHVESVAWATERKDVLYGLFFLLSLIYYLRYLRQEKMQFYLIALLMGLFSLFSKPAAIPLPLVLLLMDYFEGRKLLDKKVILEKLPFFALAIIFGLITLSFQADNAVRTLEEVSFVERIVFASYAFVMYIAKFFVPYPLYAFYPYPNLAAIPTWYFGMPIVALAITGGVLWLGRKNKFLWFGLLFFLFVISITLQLVSVGGAIMADRYTYIPYIGLAIALLMGVNALLEQRKNLEKPLMIGGIAVLAIFAALSWRQAETWRDGEALWTHLIDNSPTPVRIAYTNRGDFYKDQASLYRTNNQPELVKASYDKALTDFNKALEISPGETGTLRLRAKVNFDLSRYQQSLADYQQVVLSAPNDVEALSNIAIIQVLTKNYEEALNTLNRVQQVDPNYAPAYKTQGYLNNELGRHQASIQAYRKFLQLNGDDPTIYHSIATSYQQLGQRQQALEAINQAIRLNPGAELYQQLKQQLQN